MDRRHDRLSEDHHRPAELAPEHLVVVSIKVRQPEPQSGGNARFRSAASEASKRGSVRWEAHFRTQSLPVRSPPCLQIAQMEGDQRHCYLLDEDGSRSSTCLTERKRDCN
jgi:hypothetical protein